MVAKKPRDGRASVDMRPSGTSPNNHAEIATTRSAFLRGVRIEHGPHELLARLFIAADAELDRYGITLSFASFDELVEANEKNRASWLPLNPTFHPKNGNVNTDCAFTLLGRDTGGRVVTAQAMRIFDWQETDFKTEAESLRLLYANPDRGVLGRGCTVTTPSAHLISGRVGYGGAIWLHPSVRDYSLACSMSRIGRAYAYTRWRIEIAFGITSTALLAKGFIGDCGFPHAERGVAFDLIDGCPPDGALFWITSDEMIDDFGSFLNRLHAQSRRTAKLSHA